MFAPWLHLWASPFSLKKISLWCSNQVVLSSVKMSSFKLSSQLRVCWAKTSWETRFASRTSWQYLGPHLFHVMMDVSSSFSSVLESIKSICTLDAVGSWPVFSELWPGLTVDPCSFLFKLGYDCIYAWRFKASNGILDLVYSDVHVMINRS